jgi:hypothetical protein
MIKPSLKETTEKYELGELRVSDCESGGEMDIGVLVTYTKREDGKKPELTRECARFSSNPRSSYFSTDSIYSGYIKYTFRDGSTKRMFLVSDDEEIEPKNLPDPTIADIRNWRKDLVSLIDQLPPHVRDLFNLSN